MLSREQCRWLREQGLEQVLALNGATIVYRDEVPNSTPTFYAFRRNEKTKQFLPSNVTRIPTTDELLEWVRDEAVERYGPRMEIVVGTSEDMYSADRIEGDSVVWDSVVADTPCAALYALAEQIMGGKDEAR